MPDNVFRIQDRLSWREKSEMLERELEISQADVSRLREQIRRMREAHAVESTLAEIAASDGEK